LEKATLDLEAEIALTGGPIRPTKLAEIEAVLSVFRAHSKRKGISRLVAVGTAAIQRATNNREILALGRKLGIEMELADGRREGELGYLAATGGTPENLVCELGSRSTQVTWMTGGDILTRRIESGYVHAYETYFLNTAIPAEACNTYRDFLERQIDHLPSSMERLTALTSTTCSSYVSGLKKKLVTGTSLSSAAVHDKLQMLQALTPGEFDALKTRTRKAEKILPGLVFLDFVMERSGHDEAHITDIELPVGLIVEHFNSCSR
ncbi:MAG: hypothetical protein PVJ15_06140, partial [Gammaproteobacteria bacterium]